MSGDTASARWPAQHSKLKVTYNVEKHSVTSAYQQTPVLTGMVTSLFKNENGTGGSSPYCGCKILKLTVRPSIRGGVPIMHKHAYESYSGNITCRNLCSY